jgi:hypothetical protein
MGGGSAFWIRDAAVDDVELAAKLGSWRDRIAERSGSFLRVENDDAPPRELLTELSLSRHTDVLWIAAQSTVDAFELLHFRDGRLVRELVNGCYRDERTWERVVGDPEPWEAWDEPPVVGRFAPLDAVGVALRVFDHYGLYGRAPVRASKRTGRTVAARAPKKSSASMTAKKSSASMTAKKSSASMTAKKSSASKTAKKDAPLREKKSSRS